MSKVVYRTKDGYSFYTENSAQNHSRSLPKEMRGVERVEIKEKPKAVPAQKKEVKQEDDSTKQGENNTPEDLGSKEAGDVKPEGDENKQERDENKQEEDENKQDSSEKATVLKPMDEYNVPQLKEIADSLELEYSSKIKKADLYRMLVEALAEKEDDSQPKND